MSEAKKITIGSKTYEYEYIEDLHALAAMLNHIVAGGRRQIKKQQVKMAKHPEKERVYQGVIAHLNGAIEKASADLEDVLEAIKNYEVEFEAVEADEERKE